MILYRIKDRIDKEKMKGLFRGYLRFDRDRTGLNWTIFSSLTIDWHWILLSFPEKAHGCEAFPHFTAHNLWLPQAHWSIRSLWAIPSAARFSISGFSSSFFRRLRSKSNQYHRYFVYPVQCADQSPSAFFQSYSDLLTGFLENTPCKTTKVPWPLLIDK